MSVKFIHLDEEPPRIAKEWFQRGKDEKDAVFAFVSYWITFNQLYNYSTSSDVQISERKMIKNFIKSNYDIFEDNIDLTDSTIEVFTEAPVLEKNASAIEVNWAQQTKDIEEDIYQKINAHYSREDCGYITRNHLDLIKYRNSKQRAIITLFMYIYQVRCNLFHGNKTPTPDRDWRLVESSAKILEKVLPLLIVRVYGQ